MTFNEKLARKAVDAIEADQEHWVQGEWRCDLDKFDDGRCGTGMCFAGFVATIDGCRWAFPATGYLRSNLLLARKDDPEEDVKEKDGKRVIMVSDRARRVLGLNLFQANRFFDAGNDLAALKYYVDLHSGK